MAKAKTKTKRTTTSNKKEEVVEEVPHITHRVLVNVDIEAQCIVWIDVALRLKELQKLRLLAQIPQIGFDISYQDNFVIYMPSYDVSQLGSTLLC
ncbi:hypothetical protein Scep_030272 [Stephania cephalantha]|uniref:Uncharacterized protein n=1 Tax=Stephania cephalantha TaxID=152367 RepID=A0AAP0DZF6_9MAGN